MLVDQVDQEGIADLERAHGFQISGVVSAHDFEHFRGEDGPHNGSIFAERVEDPHETSFPGILRDPYIVHAFRADKGIGLDLVGTERAECISGQILNISFVGLTCLVVSFRNGDRQVVIAVKPCDFFYDVFFNFNVLSDGRRGHIEIIAVAFDDHFQAFEVSDHLVPGKLDAQHVIDAGNSRVYGLRLRDFRIDIHTAADNGTRADQLDQFADAVRRSFAEVRVDTLFVTAGSLGPQYQSLGRGPDAVGDEVRGFDHDGLGVRFDLGVQTAHYAGHCDRFFGVVDHQHLVVQRSFGTVKGDKFFTVVCRVDNNLFAGKAFDVKRVHRLTVFEHDEVGDIDDIVDRTHARVDQSSLQPPRGILHLDVLDDSGHVSSAERRLDFDLDIVLGMSFFVLAGSFRIPQLGTEGRRRFSCHTDHGQAVRTVRSDLKVDDRVFELHRFGEIAAERIFLFEDPDAVFLVDRNDLVFKAQFPERAEHAVGFHAAETALGDHRAAFLLRLSVDRTRDMAAVQRDRNIRALKYVRRAGHDLYRLRAADIDLTNDQFIRVRMRLDLCDPADHNAFHLFPDQLQRFQVGTGHDHAVTEFFRTYMHICIIF